MNDAWETIREKWYAHQSQYLERDKTISARSRAPAARPAARRTRTQATAVPFTPRHFDAADPLPLHRQLYAALREAVVRGQLPPGARLPATRALAAELGLSRTTVVTAMIQLLAEGYVEGRVGSGTYVTRLIPDILLQTGVGQPPSSGACSTGTEVHSRTVSRRGALLTATSPAENTSDAARFAHPLHTGLPALNAFPWRTWKEIEGRLTRRNPGGLRSYGNPAGYGPLRQAIADYLGMARAVHCQPEQIIIVSGTQQSLDLVARLLLDEGDAIWFEDPGYHRARSVFLAAGAQLIPVPVDDEGLDVSAGIARYPRPRLAYVTPSHQFPLGVTMSLARRMALLQWAKDIGAWIVEDDYDSEYRYTGRPLAALQGLDEAGCVLYAGTFSKVLFPGLRLGYLVLPGDLVDTFARARELTDLGAPVLPQAIVTEFIVAGHFSRHLRRMRELYAERQAALVTIAARELSGMLTVPPASAGLHLMGWLPERTDERDIVAAARRAEVEVMPLSRLSLEPYAHPGLVLGYAAFDARQLRESVIRLAAALCEDRKSLFPAS